MTQCEEEKEVTNQEVERLKCIQLGGYRFWNPHCIVETVFNGLWLYEAVICEDGLWWCGFIFTAVVQATDGELPDVVYCRLFFVSLHASDGSHHSAELSVNWITGQITCCMISIYQLYSPLKIFSISNNFILLQNNTCFGTFVSPSGNYAARGTTFMLTFSFPSSCELSLLLLRTPCWNATGDERS